MAVLFAMRRVVTPLLFAMRMAKQSRQFLFVGFA